MELIPLAGTEFLLPFGCFKRLLNVAVDACFSLMVDSYFMLPPYSTDEGYEPVSTGFLSSKCTVGKYEAIGVIVL